MINVAIIGYGYWGPNLVRNFAATKDCQVHTVVDFRAERLEVLKRNHSNAQSTIFYSIIFDENVPVVASPTVTKNVPANTIVAGNPAKFIKNIEL